MNTIPTNQGNKTPEQIVSELTYSSYAYNRDFGLSHESLVRIGLGNEAMRERYNLELQIKNN